DGGDDMIRLADPVRGIEIRHFGDGIVGPRREGKITATPPRREGKITATPMAVTAMALSPDGKVVAAGGQHDISLWAPATGKRLRRLGPTGLAQALAFSPDGKYLAAADGKKARLW